jgi:O-antigen/teichoic acid export membrane protein
MIGAVCTLLLQVMIAHQFGASGSGIYFLALSITTIAASIVRLGMENPVAKHVAAYRVENNSSKIVGIVNLASRTTFIISVVVASIIFSMTSVISEKVFGEPELALPLKIMAIAIVPLSLSVIYAKALQGINETSKAMLAQGFLIPLFASTGIYIAASKIDVLGAVLIYVLAAFLTMVFSVVMWAFACRGWKYANASFPKKVLFKNSWPLLLTTIIELFIQFSPFFVLAVWATIEEVGIFSVAQRTSSITSLFLVASNVVLAPKIAELFHKEDLRGLINYTSYTGLLVTIAASPIILTCLAFPKWVMSFFGEDFTKGWIILMVLSVGQLVNLLTGSVAFILIMTGHEKTHLRASMIAAILSITISILLIPSFGIYGAAISVAAPLVLVNLIRAYYVKKYFGHSLFLPFKSNAF